MISLQAGYALVVDDEAANREFVERLLQTASFKVVSAGSGAEALAATKNIPTLAIALVDHELPDVTGLELIKQFRVTYPDTLLVMATMHDDRNLIDQAFIAGVDVFLVKPHGFMELYRRLQEVNNDMSRLRQLIIDQYGPRPYKGSSKRKTGDATAPVGVTPAAVEVAKPEPSEAIVTQPAQSEPVKASEQAPAAVPIASAEPVKTEAPIVPKRKTAETKPVEPAATIPTPAEPPKVEAPIIPKRKTAETKPVEPAAAIPAPAEPVKLEAPPVPKRKTAEAKAVEAAPVGTIPTPAEPTKVEATIPSEPAKATNAAPAAEKDQAKKPDDDSEKGKSFWRFLRGGKG